MMAAWTCSLPSAIETCSCGAAIDVTASGDQNLRAALSQWRVEHRHEVDGDADSPPPEAGV